MQGNQQRNRGAKAESRLARHRISRLERLESRCLLSGDYNITPIAVSGDPAQGVDAAFAGLFRYSGPLAATHGPLINAASGAVAFDAVLDDGVKGLFVHQDGTLSTVAREGDEMPNGEVVQFGQPGTPDFPLSAVFSEDGPLLFANRDQQTIWSYDSPSGTALRWEPPSHPPAPFAGDDNWRFPDYPLIRGSALPLVASGAPSWAFQATVTSTCEHSTLPGMIAQYDGLFVASDAGVEHVESVGCSVASSGSTYTTELHPLVMNSAGDLFYVQTLHTVVADGPIYTRDLLMKHTTEGQTQLVANVADLRVQSDLRAPVLHDHFAVNDAGDVLVYGRLDGEEALDLIREGGEPQLIPLGGVLNTDQGQGSLMRDSDWVSLAANGDVLVGATLRTVDDEFIGGVWQAEQDGLSLRYRQGPETFNPITRPIVNKTSDLAFLGQVRTPSGVLQKGIWVVDASGAVSKVVEEGDDVRLADGTKKTISDLSSNQGLFGGARHHPETEVGRGTIFADNGDIVFTAQFSDYSQAILLGSSGSNIFVWEGGLDDNWHTDTGEVTNWVDERGNPQPDPPNSLDHTVIIENAAVVLNEEATVVGSLTSSGQFTLSNELTLGEDSEIDSDVDLVFGTLIVDHGAAVEMQGALLAQGADGETIIDVRDGALNLFGDAEYYAAPNDVELALPAAGPQPRNGDVDEEAPPETIIKIREEGTIEFGNGSTHFFQFGITAISGAGRAVIDDAHIGTGNSFSAVRFGPEVVVDVWGASTRVGGNGGTGPGGEPFPYASRVILEGEVNWHQGTISGGRFSVFGGGQSDSRVVILSVGGVVVREGATFTFRDEDQSGEVNPNLHKTIDGLFRNEGTVIQEASVVTLGNERVIENAGTWEVRLGVMLNSTGGDRNNFPVSEFWNFGTFRQSWDAPLVYVFKFNNSGGIIHVQKNELQLQGRRNLHSGGAYLIDKDAILTLGGAVGPTIISGNVSATGEGSMRIVRGLTEDVPYGWNSLVVAGSSNLFNALTSDTGLVVDMAYVSVAGALHNVGKLHSRQAVITVGGEEAQIANKGMMDLESTHLTVSGPGARLVNEAQMELESISVALTDAQFVNSGDLKIDGGRITLEEGQLANSGSIEWLGGTLEAGASTSPIEANTKFVNSKTLTVSGSDPHTLGGVLENDGGTITLEEDLERLSDEEDSATLINRGTIVVDKKDGVVDVRPKLLSRADSIVDVRKGTTLDLHEGDGWGLINPGDVRDDDAATRFGSAKDWIFWAGEQGVEWVLDVGVDAVKKIAERNSRVALKKVVNKLPPILDDMLLWLGEQAVNIVRGDVPELIIGQWIVHEGAVVNLMTDPLEPLSEQYWMPFVITREAAVEVHGGNRPGTVNVLRDDDRSLVSNLASAELVVVHGKLGIEDAVLDIKSLFTSKDVEINAQGHLKASEKVFVVGHAGRITVHGALTAEVIWVGGEMEIEGRDRSGGELILRGGTATGTSGVLVDRAGDVTGTGTVIFDDVTFVVGVLDPKGNSPGVITVEGDFIQAPTGLLVLEVDGVDHGMFDVIEVTGDALFAGMIELEFSSGFVPSVGDAFSLLRVSGESAFAFEEVVVTGVERVEVEGAVSDDGRFDVVVTYVPQLLAGDVNLDGVVDLLDFSWLKEGFGIEGDATRSNGDLDGNGSVSLLDFSILKGNFGARLKVSEEAESEVAEAARIAAAFDLVLSEREESSFETR